LAKLQPIRAKRPRIGLVGSDTLVGREIRDLCGEKSFPGELKLIASADAETGVLTEIDGEPAVVVRLDAHSIGDVQAVFLAGSRESALQAIALPGDTRLIDVTYAGESEARARLRAPIVESRAPGRSRLHVIAHPAATALALLLGRLNEQAHIARSVVQVFEPASERGKPGAEEIHQQTLNLLSFKPLPKTMFDAQAAFAMLARYGDDAPETLAAVESRIVRHFEALNRGSVPTPSLRVVHAPVFHGYSASLWVEFERNPGVEELERVLAEDRIDVRGGLLEPPNNVGVAGQSGIAVGAIETDRVNPNAAWIWMAADNVRLMADNAIAVVRELIG